MLKTKIITLLLSIIPFTIYCAQQPQSQENLWSTKKLEQEYLKAERENNLLSRFGSSVGEHTLKGAIDMVSNAGSNSFVEWVKKELELRYDAYPTTETKLKRCHDELMVINNAIELLPKMCTMRIEQINTDIIKIKNTKQPLLQIQEKIKQLEEEKLNINLQKQKDLMELDLLRQNTIKKFREITLIDKTSQTISDNPLKNEKPIENSSQNITEPNLSENLTKTENDKKNKSLIAKFCTILCPPFVVKGIDITAQACGPHALAHWLGSNSSFFKGKEQIISRSLVVAGAAITCTALYKIYQIFTTQEEEESDEFDMFNNFSFGK